MRGFQKYERNWILTMAFWATCKIAQPIQPIWQHIFALPWSALKKPPWEFNFFHIFGIPSSSSHEKRCQMLRLLFWLFQCSKNPRWVALPSRTHTPFLPKMKFRDHFLYKKAVTQSGMFIISSWKVSKMCGPKCVVCDQQKNACRHAHHKHVLEVFLYA